MQQIHVIIKENNSYLVWCIPRTRRFKSDQIKYLGSQMGTYYFLKICIKYRMN